MGAIKSVVRRGVWGDASCVNAVTCRVFNPQYDVEREAAAQAAKEEGSRAADVVNPLNAAIEMTAVGGTRRRAHTKSARQEVDDQLAASDGLAAVYVASGRELGLTSRALMMHTPLIAVCPQSHRQPYQGEANAVCRPVPVLQERPASPSAVEGVGFVH